MLTQRAEAGALTQHAGASMHFAESEALTQRARVSTLHVGAGGVDAGRRGCWCKVQRVEEQGEPPPPPDSLLGHPLAF